MEQGSAITFFGALHTKGLRELFIITRRFTPTPVRGLPEVNRTCRHFVFLAPLRWFVKVLDGALSAAFLEPLDGLDVPDVHYDILNVEPEWGANLQKLDASIKITISLRVYSCLFVSIIYDTQKHKTPNIAFRVYSCLFVSIRV